MADIDRSGPGIATKAVAEALAERSFRHNLLLELIEAGVLSQQQAGAVISRTIEHVRGFHYEPQIEMHAELIALGLEEMASDLLGLPPFPSPTSGPA